MHFGWLLALPVYNVLRHHIHFVSLMWGCETLAIYQGVHGADVIVCTNLYALLCRRNFFSPFLNHDDAQELLPYTYRSAFLWMMQWLTILDRKGHGSIFSRDICFSVLAGTRFHGNRLTFYGLKRWESNLAFLLSKSPQCNNRGRGKQIWYASNRFLFCATSLRSLHAALLKKKTAPCRAYDEYNPHVV